MPMVSSWCNVERLTPSRLNTCAVWPCASGLINNLAMRRCEVWQQECAGRPRHQGRDQGVFKVAHHTAGTCRRCHGSLQPRHCLLPCRVVSCSRQPGMPSRLTCWSSCNAGLHWRRVRGRQRPAHEHAPERGAHRRPEGHGEGLILGVEEPCLGYIICSYKFDTQHHLPGVTPEECMVHDRDSFPHVCQAAAQPCRCATTGAPCGWWCPWLCILNARSEPVSKCCLVLSCNKHTHTLGRFN